MTRHFIIAAITVLSLHLSLFAQSLKVSDNKRFLVEEDGIPFFWLGDTGWEMLHRIDRTGSCQLGYLRQLMESRPFLSRIPAQDLLIGGNPSFASDNIRLTRDGTSGAKDGTYLMAYLPYYRGLFEINTEVISAEKLKVWWYDPVTGKAFLKDTIENTGLFSISNWEVVEREPGSGPDWVIVIDDASLDYSEPGR